MHLLELLKHLLSLVLEDVVLSCQLLDPVLDFAELVGELGGLTSRDSQLFLALSELLSKGLVLAVKLSDLVSVPSIVEA